MMKKEIKTKAYRRQLITSYEYFAKLYFKFELSCNTPSSILNSHTWLNTWHETYWQKNWQLHCIAYFDDEELIGLAPFYIQKNTAFPFLKSIHYIGQGESEVKEVATEYLDIQLNQQYIHVIYPKLVKDLKEINADTLTVNAIFKDSHIANIAELLSNSLKKKNFNRYIINRHNWLKSHISKNTRSRIKRSNNQLNNINAEVRWLSSSEIEYHWSSLKEFHQKRWSKRGKKGAFLSQEFNQFHLSLINRNKSCTAMSAIFVNNAPIAINYYLTDDNTYYFYQSGWSEDNYAQLSPGLFLHYWSIEHCPLQYYDFMMGGLNDSYKAKFGCCTSPMLSINIRLSPWKTTLQKILRKLGLS